MLNKVDIPKPYMYNNFKIKGIDFYSQQFLSVSKGFI